MPRESSVALLPGQHRTGRTAVSYAAQIAIIPINQQNKDWELAGIFADRASGTSAKSAPSFSLMALCERKVDMVPTNPSPGFRNMDSIYPKPRQRHLSSLKKGINDGGARMALCFFSGFARLSESISRNVTWNPGFKAEGAISIFPPAGLRKRRGRSAKIVPEEAEIVKRIFRSYVPVPVSGQ